MMRIPIIIYLGALLFLLFFPFKVYGQCPPDCLPFVRCDVGCTPCDLFATGQRILNFMVFILALPATVIFMMVGGLMMIIAGGNEAMLSRGRSTFQAAVVGFIIVLVAWVVIDTIIAFLANPGVPRLRQWFNISC
ncbi:MAG: hypothetical protein ACK4NX_00720 [Candidatus Paceibacteria bacterium]